MMMGPSAKRQEAAVLTSGGLDSAVLLAAEARARQVVPIFVSVGLAWEEVERQVLQRLLAALPDRPISPVIDLRFDLSDVYPPTHWAIRGAPPGYDTPDEDVYLVGRNLALLAKTAIFCATRGIDRIALGPLAGNPFPDATPAFFESASRAFSLGLDTALTVVAPFATMTKADVIRLGETLGVPLELTVSCMSPTLDAHCGTCSKCRERQHAFRDAGIPDPTRYGQESRIPHP